MSNSPLEVLRTGVESYVPYLRESGELHDPVFGEPTQYGTAYHAYCQAALAVLGPSQHRGTHLEFAARSLDAALAHTANPDLPPTASGFSRSTATVHRLNHRDFTWPPILKAYRILRSARAARAKEFAERISVVDIARSFRSLPPSNWASVWLSGEWIRIREGLSPHTVTDVDAWLETFLEDLLRPEDGFYFEPGKPNSYDLFTRHHVADLLMEGYDGRWRAELERLMVTGLQRSLATQLSDGSLASAHRSAGQTWTLGAQVAFFTQAARYFTALDDLERANDAAAAARLAFASMRRWQRPAATYSPVENVLPAAFRVGYEGYTADAHYGNLALAFLASALLHGFTADEPLTARPPTARVEAAPTYRGVAHAGHYSVAVNADPAAAYDGFGITDLTFGPGRFLHFASSVRHVASKEFFNLGMARRTEPGRSELDVMAQRTFTLEAPIAPHPAGAATPQDGASMYLRARGEDDLCYELSISIRQGGVDIDEGTPDVIDRRTLLIPYLRDPGSGVLTQVEPIPGGVAFTHGEEEIVIKVEDPVEAMVHLPFGFENRRGLCGLIRLDLAGQSDRVRYHVSVVR